MSDNDDARLQLALPDQGPWPLNLNRMMVSEAEQCEALTGWEAEEWRDQLFKNRARAVKFAVWLARQRAGDPVAWSELDFNLTELDWQVLDEEGKVIPPAELGVTEDQEAALPTGSNEGEDVPVEA